MNRMLLEAYPLILAEIRELEERLQKSSNRPAAAGLRQRLDALQTAREQIEGFVAGLPGFRARRIVRLKALEGLSWSEVARRAGTDMSSEAARSIYRRALGLS